jgi:tetratricopeptide (TPR) repeat protein
VEEVGFSPLEALRSATINPAIYFNLEGELGTVEQGKRASLLLLNRNPLNDIKHTQEIEGIILRGKYMMGDSLRTAIEKIAEENRRPKLESALKPLISEKGIKAAISEYHRLTKERPTSYNFNREQLNSLGHSLLGENKVDEAIQIFLLNVEVYPDYGNGWDSLGEGYLAQGDTTKAVGAWETAIRKRNYSTKKRLNDLLLDYKTD